MSAEIKSRCLDLISIWRMIARTKLEVARQHGHLNPKAALDDTRAAEIYFLLAQNLEDAIDPVTIEDPERPA